MEIGPPEKRARPGPAGPLSPRGTSQAQGQGKMRGPGDRMIWLPKLKSEAICTRGRSGMRPEAAMTRLEGQGRESLEGTMDLYKSLGSKAQTSEPLKKGDHGGAVLGIRSTHCLASS